MLVVRIFIDCISCNQFRAGTWTIRSHKIAIIIYRTTRWGWSETKLSTTRWWGCDPIFLLKLTGKGNVSLKLDLQFFGSNNIFPKSKQDIKRVFWINEKVFHKEIKLLILKDIRVNKEYSKQFNKMGNNPDIGIDDMGNIILKDVRSGKTLPTKLKFKWYFP